MDQVETIARALHAALSKYAALEQQGTVRASIAQTLFGVPASKRLLPLLDELAHSVRPAWKTP